ncbi:MAG TPA: dockerin type I domain-containing protein [Candidatus Polarisedimenticolia bacterium]|nr:dockerin type I domain-containing protein [Candidatus Polarisedimenticolia bacterium]
MPRGHVYLATSLFLIALLCPASLARAHNYGDVSVAFEGVLEVTQSVQTAPQLGTEAVSLTAHKPTVIRAYLSARRYVHVNPLLQYNLHNPSFNPISVDGTLTIKQGSTVIATLPASNGPLAVVPWHSPNPEVKNSSLNFEWASPPDGAVTFTLDLTSGTSGIAALDPPSQQRTFTHNERLRIQAVKLELDHDNNPSTPPTKTPNATMVGNGKDWFLKSGPLAPCKLQYWVNPTPLPWTTDIAFATSTDLLNELAAMKSQGTVTYDNVYGWWQDGVASNGLSYQPYCAYNHTVGAYGNTDPTRYQRTFTHELYHTYHQNHLADNQGNPTCDAHPGTDPGPEHPNGEIGVVGWDTQADLPVPNEKLDVMVAGKLTAEAWLTPERYQTMWNRWMGTTPEQVLDPCHTNWWQFIPPDLFRPLGPMQPFEEFGRSTDFIHIGGAVDLDGTGFLDPAWRLSRVVATDPPGGEGAFGIIIVNSAGNPLGEWRFDPEFHVDSEEAGPASFQFKVPTPLDAGFNIDLREIRLVGPTGMVLDVLRLSPSPPVVEMTAPSPLRPDLTEPTTLQWEASDPDLDPLTCSVQYSPDNGQSYLALAGALTGATMSIDPARLPGGSTAFFRVLCTDGIRTAADTAGPFAVPRKVPQVEIADPIPDPIGPVTVCAGRPMTMIGFGSSPDDGVLPQEQLEWSSDLQGSLGTGNTLGVTLEEGTHVVRLVGTDRAGDTGSASISIAALSTLIDTDGDGVPDCSDRCPTVPGPWSNDGCPEEEIVDLGVLVLPGVGPDPPPEPRLVFESPSEVHFNVTVGNQRAVPLMVQALRYHLTEPAGAVRVSDVSLGGISIPPGGSFVKTDAFVDVFADPGVSPPDGTWTVVVEAVLGINETSGIAEQIFVVDRTLSFPLASVVPSNPMPAQGSQAAACVFIDMRNTPERLGSYGAALRWNPTVLRFLGFTGGDAPFDTPAVDTANVGTGEVRFSDMAPQGAGGDLFVACFDFEVLGPAGQATQLDLRLTSLFTATSFTDILAMAAVNDAASSVQLACTIGDANLDGDINSGDALVVLAHEIGRTIPPEPKLAIDAGCGDANGDGATNSIDANIILSFEVGLPILPSFPLGTSNVTIHRCPVCTGATAAAPAESLAPRAAAPPGGGTIVTDIVPPRGRVRPAEEFEIAVVLDLSAVDHRLGSYGAELTWDPKALRFAGVSSAEFSTPLVNQGEAERGRLRFAAASPSGAEGRVEAVRLRFVALRALPKPERAFDLRFSSLGATGPGFENLLPLVGGEHGGRLGAEEGE